MGLVADDDRVGVGDLARVAHEPLVGLDGDRALDGRAPCRARAAGRRRASCSRGRRSSPLNWSTRLRRWVRISTPPVRQASTKPSAATVLPAPVACSNQKRRVGVRVLLRSGVGGGLLLGLLGRVPVERLLVVGELLVALDLDLAGRQLLDGLPFVGRCRCRCAAGGGLGLGGEGDQRARQRVDLVGGEHGAVDELGLVVGEHALEPEDQRVLAAPLDRGLLAAGLDLGEGGVERAAAGRALGERVGGILALEHERLARKLFGAPEGRRRTPALISAGKCFQPWWPFVLGKDARPGCFRGGLERAVADAARSAVSIRRSVRVPRAAGARRIRCTASTRITAHESHTPQSRLPLLTQPCIGSFPSSCALPLLAGCGTDDPESAAPARGDAGGRAGRRPRAAGRAARAGQRAARRRRRRVRGAAAGAARATRWW